MADTMSDFAEMEKGNKPADKPRNQDGKFVSKPEGKEPDVEPGAEKPSSEATVAEKTPETSQPVRPEKAKPLREAHDALKKRVNSEYLPKIQQLEAKVKELEAKPGGDTKPLEEKLAAIQKRNEELEKHMAFVDYTQTADFKKIQDDYTAAWGSALGTFKQLSILDENTGDRRPATEEDLLTLANMPLAEMDERANELFGHSAARVITHIEKLKELSVKQHEALEGAKKNAADWKKNGEANNRKAIEARVNLWNEINKSMAEKYPKAFKAEEGNAEDSDAHRKGFALADLKYLGEKSLTPEQVEALPPSFRDTVKSGKSLTPAQHVQLDALIRVKAANHDRHVSNLKKANARIAELEKSLAEYEGSEPKATTGKSATSVGGETPEQQIEREIREMDK